MLFDWMRKRKNTPPMHNKLIYLFLNQSKLTLSSSVLFGLNFVREDCKNGPSQTNLTIFDGLSIFFT